MLCLMIGLLLVCSDYSVNVTLQKSLLGIPHDNVLIHVQDGMTSLYIASWKGHGAVVKVLLEQHADVSTCKKVIWLSMYITYDFTI